jgi:hypothetical protein
MEVRGEQNAPVRSILRLRRGLETIPYWGMKASFTSRDYTRILELAWLGLWVAGFRPEDPKSTPERYADLADKLLAMAPTYGCGDLVKADADGTLRPSKKLLEGQIQEKLDQFADDIFWAELVQRLAERDLRSELGSTKLSEELNEDEAARVHEFEDSYWREFETRGVDHLVLLRGGRG